MTKKTFKIHGMHCASCVRTIERALGKTDGVASAAVNFASESALVEFDESRVGESDLAKAVSSVGYHMMTEGQHGKEEMMPHHHHGGMPRSDIVAEAGTKILTAKVIGMDSPHCAMVVEGALKKLPGIRNSDLDFPNQRAKIAYDPALVGVDKIFGVIRDAGYSPLEEAGDSEDLLEREKREREAQVKAMKRKLIAGGVLSILVFLGSFPQWFPFMPLLMSNNWTLLILTLPVQFWIGWQFYSGLKLLVKYRTADMNTLIAIGTLAAFLYSAAVTVFSGYFAAAGTARETYFDSSAIIIELILLGKYFETLMKGRASEAIKKLIGLQPKTAKVLRDGKETEISIAAVVAGDIIVMRPGEKLPVDGVIVEGDSEIDESMITGESMPVHKKAGDSVIGSTINKYGTFTFKATKIGKDTVLSQIIKMVEQAQGSKAPIQRLADTVSSYFVPAVFVIAVITFVVWLVFGPSPAFAFALVNFVAVLIIACPCALGLATPMAIMVSSGSAATKGILVKDAASLEIANKINAIILDKTGTLTRGKPELTDVIAFGASQSDVLLLLAASLEQKSEHPLAQAILDRASREKLTLHGLEGFKAIPGKGLSGRLKIGGTNVEGYLGNRALMAELGLDVSGQEEKVASLEHAGKTVMLLAVDKKLIGALAVADVLKEESVAAVRALQKGGVEVWMLTGDNERTAKAIAAQAGIEHVMAGVLPDKKAEKVRELQEQGKVVAMVGDGINDAPALTQAHIGIAMGEGTDIAMESANITLMRGNLALVPETILLSRKTMSIIRQNLFWAFFYNVAFIPVAAGVLYPAFGILLNPIFAGAAMALSSISVVLNSLRLRRA